MRRPRRVLGRHDRDFWDHVAVGELRLQRCLLCGRVRFPPSAACDTCLSLEFEWAPVEGPARVVSWVTYHREYFPEMPVPYTVVAAEVGLGPVVIADYDGDPSGLEVDTTLVKLRFDDADFVDGGRGKIYRWTDAY